MLQAYERLEKILRETLAKLSSIEENKAGEKSNPAKWSKKEILGHLIDSASNNHQRFVRMQIDNNISLPKYKQDEWVTVQQWQQRKWNDIIALWQLYNAHISHILLHIDESKLQHNMTLGDKIFTLQFLADDYVDHMEHHLQQILGE